MIYTLAKQNMRSKKLVSLISFDWCWVDAKGFQLQTFNVWVFIVHFLVDRAE